MKLVKSTRSNAAKGPWEPTSVFIKRQSINRHRFVTNALQYQTKTCRVQIRWWSWCRGTQALMVSLNCKIHDLQIQMAAYQSKLEYIPTIEVFKLSSSNRDLFSRKTICCANDKCYVIGFTERHVAEAILYLNRSWNLACKSKLEELSTVALPF